MSTRYNKPLQLREGHGGDRGDRLTAGASTRHKGSYALAPIDSRGLEITSRPAEEHLQERIMLLKLRQSRERNNKDG